MKKVFATIALFLIGSLWYTVGKESGYTWVGLLVSGFSISLIVSLWNKKYAQYTKKIIIGFMIVSVIGIILLPVINPPIKNGSSSGAHAFKDGFRNSFIKTCSETVDEKGKRRCACLADYMVDNYTNTQLTQMNEQFNKTHEIPVEIKVAASACASQ